MKRKLLIPGVIFVALVIFMSVFLYFTNTKNQKRISQISNNSSAMLVGKMIGVGGVFDETGNVYIGSEVVFKLSDGKELGYMLQDDTTVEPLKYKCLGPRDCSSWKLEHKVLFKDFDDLQHKLECKEDPSWCRQNAVDWQIQINDKNELLNIKEINLN